MYFGMADSVHLPGTVPVGDLLPSGDANVCHDISSGCLLMGMNHLPFRH